MFPLFAVGIVVGLFGLAMRKPKLPQATTSVRGFAPRKHNLMVPGHYMMTLARMIRNNQQPPDWVVNAAMAEAFDSGDLESLRSMYEHYGEPSDLIDPADAGRETEDAANQNEGGDNHGGTVTVSGKSSPLDGVGNAEWEDFVSKLATEKPDHRTDRHVGAYHQSVDRLSQLGLGVPETPEDQYDAMVADLIDTHGKACDAGIMKDHLAGSVSVDGTDHPVTLSGLLGLLKSAGIDGAKSWLANPSDRTKFPHTTRTFLTTNGVF